MLDNDVLNFFIRDSAGQNVMFAFKKDGVNNGDAINAMYKALGLLSSGRYVIEASAKVFSDKGSSTQRIRVPFDHIDGLASESSMGNHQPAIDVQSEIQKGIAEYERKREITDLKEKCTKLESEKKELEKKIKELEKQEPFTRIAGHLEPLIGQLVRSQMGANTPAPNIGDVSPDDFTARLEKAFTEWQEVNEGTKLHIVEKIAALSKNDPQMYASARGILMKQ